MVSQAEIRLGQWKVLDLLRDLAPTARGRFGVPSDIEGHPLTIELDGKSETVVFDATELEDFANNRQQRDSVEMKLRNALATLRLGTGSRDK